MDIFTDNTSSIVNKLQHFLDVPKDKFKNVIWRIHDNNKVIYGKKIYYVAPNDEFKV